MVDIVKNISEDIFRACREEGIGPKTTALIIQQHEEIKMLQLYATELASHVEGVIDALKMSQALHRENKSALQKLQAKFDDPYKDEVGPEQIN